MIVFLAAIMITIAGVLTPLSASEANELKQELDEMREKISLQFIFGNNLMICLIMFVPFAGPVFGGYVLYNTGVIIAAESIVEGAPPLIIFLSLFIFPFAWLEFIAYSTALAESFWLFWRLIHRQGKRELVNVSILISICAVILLAAAIIEMALILSLS